MVRYHGVYASRTRGALGARRETAAAAAAAAASAGSGGAAGDVASAAPTATSPSVPAAAETVPPGSPSRASWARLLRRIFEVDPRLCPRCGGQLAVVAVLTDPKVVDGILRHLIARGLPTSVHAPAPARAAGRTTGSSASVAEGQAGEFVLEAGLIGGVLRLRQTLRDVEEVLLLPVGGVQPRLDEIDEYAAGARAAGLGQRLDALGDTGWERDAPANGLRGSSWLSARTMGPSGNTCGIRPASEAPGGVAAWPDGVAFGRCDR